MPPTRGPCAVSTATNALLQAAASADPRRAAPPDDGACRSREGPGPPLGASWANLADVVKPDVLGLAVAMGEAAIRDGVVIAARRTRPADGCRPGGDRAGLPVSRLALRAQLLPGLHRPVASWRAHPHPAPSIGGACSVSSCLLAHPSADHAIPRGSSCRRLGHLISSKDPGRVGPGNSS
jgi:hypothetical protein